MMRRPVRSVTRSVVVLLLAGCSSSAHEHPVAPPDVEARTAVPSLDVEARSAVGPLHVETAMVDPVLPAAPPPTHDRGMAALKGAGASIVGGIGGGAMTGSPFGLVLGTALGVVAAPFVAAGFAIAAPVGTDVQEADAGIAGAITRIQWHMALKDAVAKASAKHGRPIAEAPAADADRLKLTVEGPWLVVESYAALPTLTVHGELARGGDCLMDRRWRWNGDSDDFVDLGEDRATGYRTQMEQGLALLAEAVVVDTLVSAEPRAYRDGASAAPGGPPLLVTKPMDFQKQIGSWDKTGAEPEREPRCGGLPSAAPEALAPPDGSCRGAGCRNL